MNTTPPTDSNQVRLASRNPNTTAAGDTEATSEEELFYGRWTKEEETYALELIRSFGEGTLENVPDGATLRNFLAEKLSCQAKRISKKYEGSHYNGRQRFARTNAKANANELDAKRRHIAELRKTFEEARQKSQEKTRQRRSSRKRKQKAPPPTAQTAATLTSLQQDQTRPPAAVSTGSATTAASFAAATSAQQMPPAGLQADVGSLQQDILSRRLAEGLVQQRLNSLQASLAPSFSTGAGGGFASFGAFPHSSHLAAGLNLGSNANTYMTSNSGISELLTRAGLAGLTSAAPASSVPSSQISNEILLNLTRSAGISTREILLRQALHVPASGLGGGGIDTLLAQIGLFPHLLPLPPPREAGLLANMNRSGDAMNLFASAAPLPAAVEPSPPPTAVSSQEPDVVKTSFSPSTTTPAESVFFTNDVEQLVRNNATALASPPLSTATAREPVGARHMSTPATQAEAGAQNSLLLSRAALVERSAILQRVIASPTLASASSTPSQAEKKKRDHSVAGMKSTGEEDKPAKRLKGPSAA